MTGEAAGSASGSGSAGASLPAAGSFSYAGGGGGGVGQLPISVRDILSMAASSRAPAGGAEGGAAHSYSQAAGEAGAYRQQAQQQQQQQAHSGGGGGSSLQAMLNAAAAAATASAASQGLTIPAASQVHFGSAASSRAVPASALVEQSSALLAEAGQFRGSRSTGGTSYYSGSYAYALPASGASAGGASGRLDLGSVPLPQPQQGSAAWAMATPARRLGAAPASSTSSSAYAAYSYMAAPGAAGADRLAEDGLRLVTDGDGSDTSRLSLLQAAPLGGGARRSRAAVAAAAAAASSSAPGVGSTSSSRGSTPPPDTGARMTVRGAPPVPVARAVPVVPAPTPTPAAAAPIGGSGAFVAVGRGGAQPHAGHGGGSPRAAAFASASAVAHQPVHPRMWVRVHDAKLADTYFYNAVTRETAWEVPAGPGVVVVAQEELDELAATARD
jgi:hypothetical protein